MEQNRLRHAARRWIEAVVGEVACAELRLWMGRITLNNFYDLLAQVAMDRALQRDAVCMDVGCHRGSMLKLMMRCAPTGTFYAFEPLPHLLDQLRSTVRAPNVKLYGVALSNRQGEATFTHVVTNPAFSGFRKIKEDEEVVDIRVRTERLDDVLAEDPPPRGVSLIKVDVEGAEGIVFEGAAGTLSRHRPVVLFEHGARSRDAYGYPSERLHQLVTECGLRLSLLPDWLRQRRPLSCAEFCDAVYGGSQYFFVAHP